MLVHAQNAQDSITLPFHKFSILQQTEYKVGDDIHMTPTNPGHAVENDAYIGTTTDSQIGNHE